MGDGGAQEEFAWLQTDYVDIQGDKDPDQEYCTFREGRGYFSPQDGFLTYEGVQLPHGHSQVAEIKTTLRIVVRALFGDQN